MIALVTSDGADSGQGVTERTQVLKLFENLPVLLSGDGHAARQAEEPDVAHSYERRASVHSRGRRLGDGLKHATMNFVRKRVPLEKCRNS